MTEACILRILNNPETIVPGCDSSFVCITTETQGEMLWWKFRLSFEIGGNVESPKGDIYTPDAEEIIGRLYSWSRKDKITKFIFMTPEAAPILRTLMDTPAVQYKFEHL